MSQRSDCKVIHFSIFFIIIRITLQNLNPSFSTFDPRITCDSRRGIVGSARVIEGKNLSLKIKKNPFLLLVVVVVVVLLVVVSLMLLMIRTRRNVLLTVVDLLVTLVVQV